MVLTSWLCNPCGRVTTNKGQDHFLKEQKSGFCSNTKHRKLKV